MITAITMWMFFVIIVNLRLLYAHRSVTHNHVKFHPWLIILTHISVWLINSKYSAEWARAWATVHLEHHKHVDSKSDPHSPHFKTLSDMMNSRRHWYTKSEIDKITSNLDVPTFKIDRWLEKYQIGPWVLLTICLLLFQWWGILLWIVCRTERFLHIVMITYGCHKGLGYNNTKKTRSNDRSRNVTNWPFMFFYLGEELHGNHHRWPGRANLAVRWWEIDLGYWFLKLLSMVGLVSITNKQHNIKNLKFQLEK